MDAAVQSLYALLPVAWQPYVVLALIAFYMITKWRSMKKSQTLNQQKGGFTPKRPSLIQTCVEFLW